MADDEIKKEEVEEVTETETETEEPQETETPVEDKVDDLVDILGRFVEALIPEAGEMIAAVNEAEGEERVRALGRLEGCMAAWGVPCVAEEYSKHLDDKLAEFSKTILDRMDKMDNTVAQYGAPTGLKGKMGADKDAQTEPQVYEFSRQGAGIRTALY